MALEQEYIDIKKDHGAEQRRELIKRLVLSRWQHYKGGHYIVIGIYWDAVEDEWAIRYVRQNEANAFEYGRTITNFTTGPFAGDPATPRFVELGKID